MEKKMVEELYTSNCSNGAKKHKCINIRQDKYGEAFMISWLKIYLLFFASKNYVKCFLSYPLLQKQYP
jgi:hypothetical protein